MTTQALSVAAIALLSLALSAPSPARDHAHHAGTAPTGATTATTRWKPDAALHEGMGRIRREVLGLEHYQHGHIGAPQAVVLAGDIERDVAFVVSHCTLEPAADAAVHPILSALVQGAQAIRSNPADMAAIAPMRLALQRYAVSFDDPEDTTAD